MAVSKQDAALADRDGKPMIGARGAAVASVGLANNSDVATLVALKSELDAVIAALVAHGLIEAA